VHGQIAEAAVQGIGGTLLEEFVYDEAGQPLATDW
jgi:carbon-monoxide dehydrogenase large subunit